MSYSKCSAYEAKFAGPFQLEGFVKVRAKYPPNTSPKPYEDHIVNLSRIVYISKSSVLLTDGFVLCLEQESYDFLYEFIMMGSLRKEGFCAC